MKCRKGCGACCIAPSISSYIPGMPNGKPAGVRCVNLTQENECALFGSPERPKVCLSFQPFEEICGDSKEFAMKCLEYLEYSTKPE